MSKSRIYNQKNLYNSKILTIFLKLQYSKTATLQKKLFFKTNYRIMQVKSIAAATLSIFIKLPIVIKLFVLSLFKWPFYTGFIVYYFQDIPSDIQLKERLIFCYKLHAASVVYLKSSLFPLFPSPYLLLLFLIWFY